MIITNRMLIFIILFSATLSSCGHEEIEMIELEVEETINLSEILPIKGRLPKGGNAVTKSLNGDFFILGSPIDYTKCDNLPNLDTTYCFSSGVFLYKFNENNEFVWRKEYFEEEPVIVAVTTNGGCYLGTNNENINIRKIDPNGTLIWKKEFGGNLPDKLIDIDVNSNGEIICTGRTENFGGGTFGDIWTFLLSSDGETVWSKTYSFNDQQVPSKVISTKDGGFMIVGVNNGLDVTPAAIIALKYNGIGELVWVNNYHLNGWTYARSVYENKDGDFIITGRISSDQFILKLNNEGELEWSKEFDEYPESEIGLIALESSDTDFIIVGYAQNKLFINNFDNSGNILSQEFIYNTKMTDRVTVLESNGDLSIFHETSMATNDTIVPLIVNVDL